jgi:hypothetical protein
MTEQRQPWIEEELRREENRRKRAEWERRRKAEAEQREREQKQSELAAYLRRRGEDYMDHTGEKPTLDDLAAWRREYMDKKEAEYQAERASKLKAAEAEYGF